MKHLKLNQLHPLCLKNQFNNKQELSLTHKPTIMLQSVTTMVMFIFLIMKIYQKELLLCINQENGVKFSSILQMVNTLQLVPMMILFMSIRYLTKENILFTGQLHLFIHLLFQVLIGQETPDILELSIKHTPKFSMMLKILNKSQMELQHLLINQSGQLLHVNLVGKLLVFSQRVLMVQILIVQMHQETEDILLQVMITVPYAFTISQLQRTLKHAEE